MKKMFVLFMILFAITACSSADGGSKGKSEVRIGVGF